MRFFIHPKRHKNERAVALDCHNGSAVFQSGTPKLFSATSKHSPSDTLWAIITSMKPCIVGVARAGPQKGRTNGQAWQVCLGKHDSKVGVGGQP